jgi:uncharacterized protein DUF4255
MLATYHAIAATGKAILGLLEAATPPEFSTIQFKLYRPVDFQDPLTEGIGLYLYRVTTNTTRRNFPPRLDSTGRRFRPQLPIDLHYLLTPWAQTSERQHQLLGWSMRVLEDTPILPPGLLNHYGPDQETFQPDESVELVCEPLALQEIVNIWDAFKPNFQISVAYVARMITIDSQIVLSEFPPVQTRVLNFGKETVG